ncbi:FecR family protein [Ochrovirga pacifica]|uniref:FecR family protein n=1 Tax=Ochrovirga pacifica TaxID=1042376 RepID=UPI0002559FD7|nr:FecR family protein [Ochrovirga pacifica]
MKKRDILFKKLTSQLQDQEEEAFQQWLQKSEENSQLYESLTLLQKEKKEFKAYQHLDVDKAWKKVQTKSKSKNHLPLKQKVKKKSTFWMMVACIALLVGSVTGLSLFTASSTTPIEANKPTSIQTGSDKAVLTLADGTQVTLQKGKQYQTQSLQCNGEQLVYKEPVKDQVQFNYLTVPRGGQFLVQLEDGTKVWLNSETQLKYPTVFVPGQTRQVSLVYGEAYFDVSPSENHNGAAFVVAHKQQLIKVLGTEFNVKAYKGEAYVYTTLVEGSVKVNIQEKEKVLIPNQQAVWSLQDKTLEMATVAVEPEISWKQGIFHFEGSQLQDIMKVLGRWYDVDFEFENQKLKETKFVGLIKKSYQIEEILMLMKSADIITEYKINKRTIVLK